MYMDTVIYKNDTYLQAGCQLTVYRNIIICSILTDQSLDGYRTNVYRDLVEPGSGLRRH